MRPMQASGNWIRFRHRYLRLLPHPLRIRRRHRHHPWWYPCHLHPVRQSAHCQHSQLRQAPCRFRLGSDQRTCLTSPKRPLPASDDQRVALIKAGSGTEDA